MTLTRLSDWQDFFWAALVGGCVGALCLISPVIALAVVVGCVFVITALRKPIVICYVVVTATVFLSGMPRGHLINLFIPNEPILILMAGLSFFTILVRKRQVVYSRSFLGALLIFIVGTAFVPLVAYYVRDFSLKTSDIFSLIAPVQYLVLVWMFSQIPQNDTERAHVLQWMLFCASGVALIGLLQTANVGPVTKFLSQWYPSTHEADALELGRVTSVLGAWNSLGNYLMIALIVILATYRYKYSRLGYLNMAAAAALCGSCLIASGSYASLFGLVLGIVIIKGGFDRHGLKILLLFLIAFVIGAVLLQDNIAARLNYQFGSGNLVPETLTYRFTVWQQVYFPVIGKHLLWGVNPTFAGFVSWGWAESQYLYLLFRSGLVSLVAHLIFIALLLHWLYRRIRSSANLTRMIAVTVFTILVALSIMGFTNEVFTSSGAIDYLWMLIGVTAGSQLKAGHDLSVERRK